VSDEGVTVKIKHAMFSWKEPVLDENGEQVVVSTKRGQERPKFSNRHASRGQTVTVPPEVYDWGEERGAFMSVEEDAVREAYLEEAATGEPTGGAEAGEAADLNFDDQDQLVNWIRNAKPTAPVVISAADGDPDKAAALMEAEEEATGGQPRKTVMDGLQKIAAG
jgi:hypothetical protein